MTGDFGNDDELTAAVEAAPAEAWDRLRSAADALAGFEGELIEWGGGDVVLRIVAGVERPVTQMPYAIYAPVVLDAMAAVGGVGAVQPFDWMSWPDLATYRGGNGMADAPLADAVRMATACVRSDRFTEGSFGGSITDGTIPAVMARLLHWYDHERRTAP